MAWNVLRVRFGHEEFVANSVVEMGYRSFCPLYRTTWVNRGRKIERLVPLWATYVLADWPVGDGAAWHLVMDLDGVNGVIGGENPMRVQESEVEGWVSEADSSGVVTSLDVLLDRIKRGYGRGDRVKIEGGSFHGASGICGWYDASGVSVKIALLGREVNVYASLASGARVVLDDAFVSRSETRRSRRRHKARTESGTWV